MTKFQFFNLIKGLQIGALCDNFVLENVFDGGTIHDVFTEDADVNKDIVPGSYIWVWSEYEDDIKYIDELIYDTLHIRKDVVASWIQYGFMQKKTKHYILLVDKGL